MPAPSGFSTWFRLMQGSCGVIVRVGVALPLKAGTRRVRREMPDDVYQALVDEGLLEMYEERPAYQQNDYVGWISRAKKANTRHRRLDQMLDELGRGGVYMKMEHRPSARN